MKNVSANNSKNKNSSSLSNKSRTGDRIFRKGDIILLVLLLIAVILTIVFAVSGGADYVEIYIDGDLKYQIDINSDTEIDLLDGAMKIVVRNGKAWVEYSDCAEQLCVHSSPIRSDGGMIVCLPNRVVVRVDSREVVAIT